MTDRNRLRYALAASLLPILSPAAFAQDRSETGEDVIYVTAARTPLLAEDATASITKLDEDDIDARGSVFVADILRAVPGLAVSRSGAPGSLTQIRARGSEANHVLVLIDGVEASNPFSGEVDFAHLAFDNLASIEVARGEQSALWGADAIGGVIRLTSRRPDSAGVTLRGEAEAGSFETQRGSAGLAWAGDSAWATVNASAFSSDGIDVSGQDGERDGYDNRTFHFAAGTALTGAVRLEGSARWVESENGYDSDTDFDGRLDNVPLTAESGTVYARLALLADQDLGGFTLAHEGALQLTDDTAETFNAGTRTGRSLGQRLQAHYELTGTWQTGETGHRLTGLIEHDRDRLKSFSAPGAGDNQSRTVETDALAADYGLDHGPLDLSLSARHETHDRFEDATTWRAGAGWSFDGVGGRLRGSYGEGVKNPGIYELFGFFPGAFAGNPDLVPERSKGWEIGWDQTLLDGDAFLSAVWFSSELEDEIYTDFGAFPSTARNRDRLSTREGLELAGRWQATGALSLLGSLTLLDSEEDGTAEIRRPETLASLTIDWSSEAGPLSGAVTIDHIGDQLDTDFGTFQTVTLDAYTLVGGQLRWAIRDGVEAWVRGENLFDEEYQDVFGYHTPGRGLYLGLRLSHG